VDLLRKKCWYAGISYWMLCMETGDAEAQAFKHGDVLGDVN
jgi:hypothetical protein